MTVSLAVPDVLVARAQAGDEAALEALYRAFEAPVYNLVVVRKVESRNGAVSNAPSRIRGAQHLGVAAGFGTRAAPLGRHACPDTRKRPGSRAAESTLSGSNFRERQHDHGAQYRIRRSRRRAFG